MKAWSINKYNRLNGVLVTIHSYIVQAALSVPIKFRLEPLFSYSFDFDYMFAIQAMLQWSGREECGMGKCAVGLFSFSLNFMGLSWCNRKSVKALAFTYRRRYMRIVFSIIVFFFFFATRYSYANDGELWRTSKNKTQNSSWSLSNLFGNFAQSIAIRPFAHFANSWANNCNEYSIMLSCLFTGRAESFVRSTEKIRKEPKLRKYKLYYC